MVSSHSELKKICKFRNKALSNFLSFFHYNSLMGIPRLIFLKQLSYQIPKTVSKLPTKPHLNLTRTFSSTPINTPLYHKIIESITNSPKVSAIPLLEKIYSEDNGVLHEQLPRIIRNLRKQNLFDRAFEVSEWASNKSLKRKDSDLAVHLDLVGKVQGIEAAEKFLNEANEHSERMYGSLLNCYVQAKLVDKSVSHFNKMKEMGIAASSLTYNSILSLYLKTGQAEKALNLMVEMDNNGVSPDDVTYRMCLKAFALNSDFNSIDKLLKAMEDQRCISLDWFTYSTVANYYIEGGLPEKAIICLQKAELMVRGNPVGYNNLISMYSKLGDLTEVVRLWQKHKDVCKTQSNTDYSIMLGALIKLDKFQQAEILLEDWELSGNVYDPRVPEVLLMGYAQKEQVEKAEKLLESMIGKNMTPVPRSWSIISEGYVKLMNIKKAVQCMEKSLQLGAQHKGWAPKKAVISTILNWLGDHGDFEQVYDFLKLMSRVVPMNKNMYQALVNACNRQGKDIDVILKMVKGDNIDVDEEISKVMEMKI